MQMPPRTLISAAEAQRLFSYKTRSGFYKFIKRYDDFPPRIKRGEAIQAHVFYSWSAILEWTAKHGIALDLDVPAQDFDQPALANSSNLL